MDRPAFCGGVLISLGLTKAFDSVRRMKIYEALEHFAVDPSYIRFLEQVYQDTSVTVVHKGQQRTIPTYTGIRQGCKAAPCLWSIIVTYILDKLTEPISRQWIDDDNTIYADDWIVHSTFHSSSQLSLTLRRFGLLLDILADMGLQVNDKTVALLQMQGSQIKKLQKKYVKRKAEGACLRIP